MGNRSASRVVRAWIWGILVGGAAGFTIGLLTAPEQGRRMRRRFAYHIDTIGSRITKHVDRVLGEDSPGAARQDGDALVEDARNKARQIQHDIDALLGEFRHRKTG